MGMVPVFVGPEFFVTGGKGFTDSGLGQQIGDERTPQLILKLVVSSKFTKRTGKTDDMTAALCQRLTGDEKKKVQAALRG